MLGDSASGFVVAVVTMFSIADIITENPILANGGIKFLKRKPPHVAGFRLTGNAQRGR